MKGGLVVAGILLASVLLALSPAALAFAQAGSSPLPTITFAPTPVIPAPTAKPTAAPRPTATPRPTPTATPLPTFTPTPAPTSTPRPTPAPYTCRDSESENENGERKFIAGVITIWQGATKISEHADACISQSAVREFYCYPTEGDTPNLVQSYTSNCECSCANGACTPERLSCADTDGGMNPSTKGTAKSTLYCGNAPKKETSGGTDSCSGPDSLTEYYCWTDNEAHPLELHCECGCANGACKPKAKPKCVDSDGGILLKTPGTTAEFDQCGAEESRRSDYCQDSDSVFEYYCVGDQRAGVSKSCRAAGFKKCLRGKCA